jgi:general secretion pathway protein K
MSRRDARQRGFALLIVMWSLGIFALVGSQMLMAAREEASLAGSARELAALKAAADGAVQRAIFARLDPSNQQWDANGVVHLIRIGRVPVAVHVYSEADKVNLNFASPDLLEALFSQVGADAGTAAALTGRILEWREGGGASSPTSSAIALSPAAARDDRPRGTQFVNLDELQFVSGMTPVLLERLLPHVTVLSDRDPDATTHDPVVARALSAVGETGGADGADINRISVFADARGAGNTHFAVRVVVETNAQAEGVRYRILSYVRSWDGVR